MFQPETYTTALILMTITMLCWGSWANTMKLVPKWPFQLFYWDYVLGVILVTFLFGMTLGSTGGTGESFAADLGNADSNALLYGLAGGIVFNVANLLLVAAIAIAGMAVAFPVGIGIALVVGVLLNYVIAPAGNPILLFGGVALVLAAIIVDAMAYKARGDDGTGQTSRGLKLSVACGILMGSFYPLVTKASEGPNGLGPYGVVFIFAIGVLLCAIPVNTYLMKKPITGDPPTSMSVYFSGGMKEHVSGVLGGMIWGTGMTLSLVAGTAALVGPAVSYAIGQGATMVSAIWGVFIWREFADAPHAAKKLLPMMFILFLAGLGLVAIAPLY
jgi:glucose uptake protein